MITMKKNLFILLFIVFIIINVCSGRKHHLEIRNDLRRYIALSTFGFYQGGVLDVKLSKFLVPIEHQNSVFGLTLDKTVPDIINPYLNNHQSQCLLESHPNGQIIYFIFDLKNNVVKIDCSADTSKNFHIYKDIESIPKLRSKRQSFLSSMLMQQHRRKRSVLPVNEDESIIHSGSKPRDTCNKISIPITSTVINGQTYYSMNFVVYIAMKQEEGLYNLYFHACPNYDIDNYLYLEFDVDIQEDNNGNFLSAGEMPLPALYFMLSILFCLSGLFWVFILNKSKHPVYKIHILMAVLVFLKSLSLLFHSINYHFIEVKGEHVEAWAILFYITHLLKGAVLFITIVLIGTGWTFIKHILSDKDKKLFMIVIPLQVLANVAEIIIAESEAGDKEHRTWLDIFLFVDLLCCGAILIPVVWSIRHLQEASATDGKAAINLRKLKLFRQFYIMIVCYIYFTRIVVYLLKITVAFQYGWFDEMFKAMGTYVFFVLTGYKFRPTSSHPYFTEDTDDDDGGGGNGSGGGGDESRLIATYSRQRNDLADDDTDDNESQALTESGLNQGVHKTNISKSINRNTTLTVPHDIDGKDEERENLLSKRESSHEYD